MKPVFFTDLDGTLLDHDTYSYELSLEGIALLRNYSIPLVPLSSKTFDEIAGLMKELGLDSPFAFENGSGIAYPGSEAVYKVDITGPGVEQLQDFLPELERISGRKLKSILTLSIEEVMRFTGLNRELSIQAKKRKSGLPFITLDEHLLPDSEIDYINARLLEYKLHVTRGGRFNHIIPLNAGKDFAVKKIIEFYRDKYKDEIITAAAGDSLNDLPMLEYADHPYIIRKNDGSFVFSARGKVMEINGPAGFTLAVRHFLKIITDRL